MTHTVSIVSRDLTRTMRIVIADVAIGTYTAGGEALLPAEFGLVDIVTFDAIPAGTTGYMDSYIDAGQKLYVNTATSTQGSGNVGTHRLVVYGH
jgi:hypothetical protein